MERSYVMLDTSFFIRLLNEQDPLHENTLAYYKYFLQNEFILKTSTISVAEYCVKGAIDELPLQDVQIVPFNVNHATRAGNLAAIVFQNKNTLNLLDRKIIPNDTKLFAQADTEEQIQKFATSDAECIKVFNVLNQHTKLKFDIINIRNPYNETFGILDLK
jgi:predicted nucleic acid-binding protein